MPPGVASRAGERKGAVAAADAMPGAFVMAAKLEATPKVTKRCNGDARTV